MHVQQRDILANKLARMGFAGSLKRMELKIGGVQFLAYLDRLHDVRIVAKGAHGTSLQTSSLGLAEEFMRACLAKIKGKGPKVWGVN